MNEHRLRALGYTVRYHEGYRSFVLDTPTQHAAYASHNEASLWQVARKLERARMVA